MPSWLILCTAKLVGIPVDQEFPNLVLIETDDTVAIYFVDLAANDAVVLSYLVAGFVVYVADVGACSFTGEVGVGVAVQAGPSALAASAMMEFPRKSARFFESQHQ